ncbi:unnamed protein product [Closterium sp. Naga37s-1]|nr:unnamed protein product [Closterium sp. Naga37s-1]
MALQRVWVQGVLRSSDAASPAAVLGGQVPTGAGGSAAEGRAAEGRLYLDDGSAAVEIVPAKGGSPPFVGSYVQVIGALCTRPASPPFIKVTALPFFSHHYSPHRTALHTIVHWPCAHHVPLSLSAGQSALFPGMGATGDGGDGGDGGWGLGRIGGVHECLLSSNPHMPIALPVYTLSPLAQVHKLVDLTAILLHRPVPLPPGPPLLPSRLLPPSPPPLLPPSLSSLSSRSSLPPQVHKLVDLTADPNRESLWHLEVMEAHIRSRPKPCTR